MLLDMSVLNLLPRHLTVYQQNRTTREAMPFFVTNSNRFVVANKHLTLYDLKEDTDIAARTIDFHCDTFKPKQEAAHIDKSCVDTVTISPCDRIIAITVQKELLLYNLNSLEFMCKTEIEKSASCVRFFNKTSRILLADKCGMVSFYEYGDVLKRMDVRLGHNSMLTDALVADYDDFVITSDRDEKIRVSKFPNVYNIQSYCLGHKQFVSSLNFIPSNHSIIFSTSGDGTIRFWDYINGKELCKFQDADDAIVRAVGRPTSVKNSDLIAVQYLKELKIGILSANMNNGEIEVSIHQVINLAAPVLDVSFKNETLLYLCHDDPVTVSSWPTGELAAVCKKITADVSETHFKSFNILFKREFDEVQEYHKRKKARLLIDKRK